MRCHPMLRVQCCHPNSALFCMQSVFWQDPYQFLNLYLVISQNVLLLISGLQHIATIGLRMDHGSSWLYFPNCLIASILQVSRGIRANLSNISGQDMPKISSQSQSVCCQNHVRRQGYSWVVVSNWCRDKRLRSYWPGWLAWLSGLGIWIFDRRAPYINWIHRRTVRDQVELWDRAMELCL